MSSSLKTVVVLGATGVQGGSVVDSLLESGKYHIRGITRNTKSPSAQALVKRGVDVITADLNNKDSLIKAFQGAYAIFGITDFYEPFFALGPVEAEKLEIQQAKNLADAAAATDGLSHYIWSTLPSAEVPSNGKRHVPHFDGKAKVDDYIIHSQPELAKKTTFLWLAFYATNFTAPVFAPTLVKSIGKYVSLQPVSSSTPVPLIGSTRANVGIFALAILEQPNLTRGKYVLAQTDQITFSDVLSKLGEINGYPTVHVQISLEDYIKLYGPIGEELGLMSIHFEEAGDNFWYKEGITALTSEDLGIDSSKLVSSEATWKAIDWKQISEK